MTKGFFHGLHFVFNMRLLHSQSKNKIMLTISYFDLRTLRTTSKFWELSKFLILGQKLWTFQIAIIADFKHVKPFRGWDQRQRATKVTCRVHPILIKFLQHFLKNFCLKLGQRVTKDFYWNDRLWKEKCLEIVELH